MRALLQLARCLPGVDGLRAESLSILVPDEHGSYQRLNQANGIKGVRKARELLVEIELDNKASRP